MKGMMKNGTLIALLLLANTLLAQPNLGQFEMSVTEKYKARVGEAVKYPETPDFEDTTTSKLPVNYRISSQPVEVQYTPEPISPARIAKVPVEELYNGMVRLGFGLYVSPLAEAYWNSGRSSDRSFGFWGRHYSTQQGVKQTIFKDNSMNQNELGGYYNQFYRKMKWETRIFGQWDKYSYYGVDAFPSDSLTLFRLENEEGVEPRQNWFRQYDIQTSIKGENDADLGWLDEVGVNYYNFTDAYNGQENYFRINSFWQLPAGENNLDLGLNLTNFNLAFDSLATFKQSYFTLQARPKVTLVLKENLLFDFGFNLYANNYKSDSTGGEFSPYFFPEVKLRYPFVEDVLSAYTGVRGQMEHNSFRHITRDNPYITPAFISRPTRTTDLYLGIEGILSSTTSFNVHGGVMLQKDLVLYYRDPFYRNYPFTDSASFPGLNVLYDNSETFYVRGELALNLNDNLQGGVYGELISYNTKEQEEAWHRPGFLAGLNLEYTLAEKLKFGTQLDYVGTREAFQQEINPAVESTLPAYLDAGLDFEYLYNSRLTGFLTFSNLLSRKYDMYLGYKAQSINFLMGFSYKF